MRTIALCFAIIFLLLPGVRAQGVIQGAPPVQLGTLDTSNVTYDALMSNTRLISQDNRWMVARFTVSITLPTGKTYGPFAAEGAELPEAAIKVIKRLKTSKAEISIQEIKMANGSGVEKFTYPIVLRFNN